MSLSVQTNETSNNKSQQKKSPLLLNQKRKRDEKKETANIKIIDTDYFSKKENLLKYVSKDKNCEFFNEKIEIEELISKGGFGSVFSGHLKTNLNKKVSLKFLMENVINKNQKPNYSEIIIHKNLRNKNICDFYGYFKINEGLCMVMEYFKFGDIENFKHNIIYKTTFSETFLNYLSKSILDALQYLHERNKIIHMDIKPQNILINDYLIIKLTDFSVSYNYKNKEKEIELPMVGTCYYMSPEVLDKTKNKIKIEDASKIDLYSLGVTLFFLAFGDFPYNLKSVGPKDYEGIKNSIENNQLILPKNKFSKKFLNFIQNLLNKDINKRYNITQAMNDPWIKGSSILLDEKEKLFNSEKFLYELLLNGVREFNNYVH